MYMCVRPAIPASADRSEGKIHKCAGKIEEYIEIQSARINIH